MRLRFTARGSFYLCGALLVLFGVLSYSAILTKSATMDEPLHVASAYVVRYEGDFRLDPENPPLWKYFAALGAGAATMHDDAARKARAAAAQNSSVATAWAVDDLYRTQGVNGARVVNSMRLMMVFVGIALGALVSWWAEKLAGKVAAVVACALYALDPNFLAHSSIVKNDVAMALLMTLMAYFVWRAGKRMTVLNVLGVAVVCAAAVNVKFSGVVLGPIAVACLIARVLLGGEWRIFGRAVRSRMVAIVVVCGVGMLIIGMTIGVTWCAFQFQYSAGPGGEVLDLGRLARGTRFSPIVLWIDHWHLMPQAWSAGFLTLYNSIQTSENYLLGRVRETGWWYYFPVAMCVKTAMATLVGFIACIVLGVSVLRRRVLDAVDGWTAIVLAGPALVYLALCMRSNLDHGVRHVLPVYPFVYLWMGVVAAAAVARWGKRAAWGILVVVLSVGIETLAAYPDWIAFFNVAAGGSRGGFRLLGDSNLDWGQDLPALARWQEAHPNERLYLCYFGSADPAFYGIRYINLPSGYFLNERSEFPTSPGVIAVSATKLQGLYVYPEVASFYAKLREKTPREVLGESIYLFDYAP